MHQGQKGITRRAGQTLVSLMEISTGVAGIQTKADFLQCTNRQETSSLLFNVFLKRKCRCLMNIISQYICILILDAKNVLLGGILDGKCLQNTFLKMCSKKYRD